jgi:2-aminoadipate transaminase
MDVNNLLATRTSRMKASAIRELLKIATNPGMISLGGGLPSPDSFPLDLIPELTEKVINKYGSTALQYDITEGFVPLRKALIDYCQSNGIEAKIENIYITSGSQGFLDSIGKLLVSPGDLVAVEGPTYMAALQALNAYGAKYIRMDMDDEGLIPESLENVLKNNKVKFVYSVPTFQNPSGKTIGLKRREQIAEIVKKYDVLFIEDDPYSAIRYTGDKLPTIKSMAPDNVVYVSTFSKIFAPGLRLGFFVAPESFGKWMVVVKQGVDLNTSTYSQALATEYLLGGYLPNQIKKIISIYKPKLEVMLDALKEHMPSEYKFTKPEGGMFVWVHGPNSLDMEDVFNATLKKNVGFVPGKFFYPDPEEGLGTMRLNFTQGTPEKLRYAIKIIGETIKEEIALRKQTR